VAKSTNDTAYPVIPFVVFPRMWHKMLFFKGLISG
jgi:hypothetical protein